MEAIFYRNGKETPEPVKAELSGTIPSWLQGTLLRNGPGLFSIGESSYNHWFDGMALIHSFTFKDGEVYYRSKFLRSGTYKKNTAANRIVVTEFGTLAYPEPSKNIFSKAFTYLINTIPDFTDNNIINIIRYGEDYYASSEINYINQINPSSLDTIGRSNYRDYIALNLATAHPHYDDEGNTYNMGTAIMALTGPKYVIFRVPSIASDKENKRPALRKVEHICSIPFHSTLYPSYFHSFGMTENYIIFVEQALKLDIIRLTTAYIKGVSWGKCLKYDKDDITLFHVINRRTGKVAGTKFYTDAFVMFHHINAYEEDGHVVFDLITYEDNSLYDMFYLKNMRQDAETFDKSSKVFSLPVCQRFVIPIDVDLKVSDCKGGVFIFSSLSATLLLFLHWGFVCLAFVGNKKLNFQKVYTLISHILVLKQIAKVDTITRTHIEWMEDECYPSEPVFVASPGAVDEDDGVILSSVISLNPKKTPFLLVLDAKTFKEIARASVNTTVHMDLHGLFIHQ
uniref:Beta-carotene oxygenase 1, like n=1 Tax=Electrophorus electricus TaxID=8005 RepID=A0AAY5F026_ELEEL